MNLAASIAATPSAAVEWQIADNLTDYPGAIATMESRVAAIRAGTASELVWLVEHPPTFTAGTSADPADLRNPAGFPTFAAGRGGQWTYHGPGQRIAYTMLDLSRRHGRPGGLVIPPRDIRQFVAALEQWLICALAQFHVHGERRQGRVGIWVVNRATGAESKIAAIGVRVTRWVSWHGIALNVAPDLTHFGGIVPCGIRDHGVTSLEALGIPVTMAQADAALRVGWVEVFGD